MNEQRGTASGSAARPKRRWPGLLLVLVLLGLAAALFWMSREVQRIRRIRDLNTPPPATNATPTSSSLSSPPGPA